MGRKPCKRSMAIKGKNIDFLRIGSMVEVSSVDEGFKGAWYVAKILESDNGRKPKLVVQYQTLLASDTDPNQLLTEKVGISFIRPLPPPPAADQSYEVHDVVDAFHRDGWWKGVVSEVEVVEGEEKGKCHKYSVVFETPPEKFDFYSQDLRFHSVWTGDAKWVQSPKQKRMAGLFIGKGMAVEVNFDREEFKDAWFPAIVVEEVGFNSFLVEYSISGNDNKNVQMKETVDSFHIRPPTPKLEIQNFEIFERVEAFHNSCWKKGTIVATFTQGRYNVLMNSGKEIEFSQSELRPRLTWLNGKWNGFREVPTRTLCEEQPTRVDNIVKHSNVEEVAALSSSAAKYRNGEKSSCKRMSDKMPHSRYKSPSKKSRRNLLDIEEGSNGFAHKDTGEPKNVCEGTAELEDCASEGIEFTVNADAMFETSEVIAGAHTEKVGESSDSVNGVKARDENCNKSPVKADNELLKKHTMPFTRRSPLWEYIDSLDVFQSMPQKPHFGPLLKCLEAIREAHAIGKMLIFSSLVENTSKLRDIQDFKSSLKALADLELHGFDVKPVVDQINKLLAIKTRQEQLKGESQEIRRKVAKLDAEETEMVEQVNAIDKMLKVFKIVHQVKWSEKAKLDAETIDLRHNANKIGEAILKAKLDFEREAAAPW